MKYFILLLFICSAAVAQQVEYYRSLGEPASGYVDFSGVPTAGDTVTINGTVYTFDTTYTGDTISECVKNLERLVNAAKDADTVTVNPVSAVWARAVGSRLWVVASYPGTEGNSLTLAESGTKTSVSGATLSGGTAAPTVTVFGYTLVTNSLFGTMLITNTVDTTSVVTNNVTILPYQSTGGHIYTNAYVVSTNTFPSQECDRLDVINDYNGNTTSNILLVIRNGLAIEVGPGFGFTCRGLSNANEVSVSMAAGTNTGVVAAWEKFRP